ncbi:mitochondrial fission 1 protein isoform X2 [Manis pentadactyla]|uniref:mitochondrial fission 1 protein isoform X2 n=1 Tax=Manis pentadactyla TaxID=143292 RepID=UPI00255C98D2|nr:mitochondrial fission 1 protein isoform X2 [Manis pentadactyla]
MENIPGGRKVAVMKTSPCAGRMGSWRLSWKELLPKGSKEEQRDYVFYLAVGNYRLKEYEKALKYVRGLLQTEPQNNQAKELERLIDKAMKKDGLVGMAIVGGMALGVAGLAGLIGLAVSKSKS